MRDRDTLLTVEVLRGTGAFDALAGEWDALAARFATPVLGHAWLAADLAAYHAADEARILCVRHGGRLVAACLLTACRSGPPRRWEAIATDCPGSLVHADDDALAVLLGELARLGDPVILRGLPETQADLRERLRSTAGARGLWVFRPGREVYCLDLPSDWQTVHATLPGRRRKQLRRKERIAETLGEVRFAALSPDAAAAREALGRFFEVENRGWKGERGVSILARPEERAFLERIGTHMAALGCLRVFFLEIGGRVAAGQMAIVHSRRLWGLKIGYDPDFAQCSPGLLLDAEVLRDSVEAGLAGYEFMGEADPWEAFWNPRLKRYFRARLYPLGPSGALALARDAAAFVLRRLGWKER